MLNLTSLPPLSLYIHLPWCVKKCPYCDFNSHVSRDHEPPFEAYVDALIRDLEHDLPMVWGRSIRTIFIGGGTPSLFPADAVKRLLSEVRARLPFNSNTEVTLEANPGTVELQSLSGYLSAGVNRVSLGVQSFNDGMLSSLGRIHTACESENAIQIARDAGFTNINIDLMFALPDQDLTLALADIEQAIRLQPNHISLYQLTIEPNTYFHRYPPQVPVDDLCWEMQEALQYRLAEGGYRQYEVSAYAKPGCQSEHNLNYWTFGDYLGIGAGAHGKITTMNDVTRVWKTKQPVRYMDTAGTGAAIGGASKVSSNDLPLEFMMNALRLAEGFDEKLFVEHTGMPLSSMSTALDLAISRSLLQRHDGKIIPTEHGHRYLNDLLGIFLDHPPHKTIPICVG